MLSQAGFGYLSQERFGACFKEQMLVGPCLMYLYWKDPSSIVLMQAIKVIVNNKGGFYNSFWPNNRARENWSTGGIYAFIFHENTCYTIAESSV